MGPAGANAHDRRKTPTYQWSTAHRIEGRVLLDLVIATTGGRELWSTLRRLKVDISIGGPIWATKGWPPDTTVDQTVTLDTAREHIAFTPFTRPDRQMVFDAATDAVAMQTLDGEPVETLAPARAAFRGMLRNSARDALHLGYFLGYACWNYFTTPFLFMYPGVETREVAGGASRCASHPRAPHTVPTRCSTSTASECSAA